MNIPETLLAYMLSQGAHTLGHFKQGNDLGIGMKLDGTAEIWDRESEYPQENARIHGAGYRAQNALAKMADGTKYEPTMRMGNALNKLGYLLGENTPLPPADGWSDNDGLDRSIGKHYGREALAISALADLYKAKNPGQNWDLGYWQDEMTGAPGLQFEYRW